MPGLWSLLPKDALQLGLGVRSVLGALSEATGGTIGVPIIATGAVALVSQGVAIMLYGMWRDWLIMRAFFYKDKEDKATHVPHTRRNESPPDLPREEQLNELTTMVCDGWSAYLIAGSLGCGKSWLLSRAATCARDRGGVGVAYVDIRPDSGKDEFVVQLAEAVNFRFQRTTSWFVRLAEWFFQQNMEAESGSEEGNRDLSDFQRLTQAVEKMAARLPRKPTLIIDNLQNLVVKADEEGADDSDDEGEATCFCHQVLNWAVWCTDRELLRLIVSLPSTQATHRLLQRNPKAKNALNIIEIPNLREENVRQYLFDHIPMGLSDVGECYADELIACIESPHWARKILDMRLRLGRSWEKIHKQFIAIGSSCLEQYDLWNFEVTEDCAENARRSGMWRLLIQLVDEHAATRRGVQPYGKGVLGEKTQAAIDEMLRTSLLGRRLTTGELRIRVPALRYVARCIAGTPDSQRRVALVRTLDELDPDGGETLRRHRAARAVRDALCSQQFCADERVVYEWAMWGFEADRPQVLTAADGRTVRRVNAAFERVTGRAAAEAVGASLSAMLQGDITDQGVARLIGKAVQSRRPTSARLVNYRKDGAQFINRFQIKPVSDSDGVQLWWGELCLDDNKDENEEGPVDQRALGASEVGVSPMTEMSPRGYQERGEEARSALSAAAAATGTEEREVRIPQNCSQELLAPPAEAHMLRPMGNSFRRGRRETGDSAPLVQNSSQISSVAPMVAARSKEDLHDDVYLAAPMASPVSPLSRALMRAGSSNSHRTLPRPAAPAERLRMQDGSLNR